MVTPAVGVAAALWIGLTAPGAEPAPTAPAALRSDDPAVRTGAAQELFRSACDGTGSLNAVADLVRARETPADVRLALLTALAQAADPPRGLEQAAGEVLDMPVDAETLLAALRSLGGYRTRSAVQRVLRFAQRAGEIRERPDLLQQALDTLETQTGHGEPSRSLSAWQQWWRASQGWTDARWGEEIAGGQASRARTADAARDAAEAKLVDVYKRLVVTLPPEQRSGVIAEMIASPTPEVRRLGIDQATRAALNGQALGAEVVRASVARLPDPDPRVRADCAGLLEKLDSASLGDLVARACEAALARESDPAAAAPLLRVVGRHPSAVGVERAAPWIESDSPAFGPAVDAVLAALGTGPGAPEPDGELMARLHSILVGLSGERQTPGTVALLARIGSLEEVVPLLASSRPEVAAAAGRALESWPGAVDRLVEAARSNPVLVESAVGALKRHRASAEGFALAEQLPGPAPERRADLLADFARSLPVGDLLKVCQRQTDLVLREKLARSAVTPGFFTGDGPVEAKTDLVLLLARTRLALKNPGDALAALDTVCPAPAPCAWGDACRVTALAWLDRLDDAAKITRDRAVPVEAWLECLASAIELPHAPRVVQAIRELYSSKLTPEQNEKLAALAARLPAAQAEVEQGEKK